MVVVSIIMGLGIAALLRGTINALRAESSWRPGLLHSLWVVNVLVLQVGLWALRWSGEQRDDWSFGVLLAFLLMPILYYALSELLFPRQGGEVDLSEYFLSNRRTFFAIAALTQLSAAAGPLIFYNGVNPAQGPLFAYLGTAAADVYFMFSTRRRLHLAWAGLTLFGSFWSFGLLRIS